MLALADHINAWHWVGFLAFVFFALALDLGVFHHRAHEVRFKEALCWTGIWVGLALLFALGLRQTQGQEEALEFLSGYLIEMSLSMDNVFVMALVFAYFHIPAQYQHRVLFWGILGALVMRGFMIGVGVALIDWVSWVLYVFGAFLVYSGVKMLFVKTQVDPEKNRVIRWARRLYPVSPHLDGQKFTTRWNGRAALTPLALVLLMIETTDLVFAVDSIPAVFAVTTRPFVVFTSNVFAILGLRSLYFVLAGAIAQFRYLKYGLSLVLVFVGVKMLIAPNDDTPLWFQFEIPTGVSLCAVAAILLVSVVASLAGSTRKSR